MTCYVFSAGSDLICHFLPDTEPLTLCDTKTSCFMHQMDFYGMLTEDDASRFTGFCRGRLKTGRSSASAVPSLLLFPHTAYTSVFAERYTSQLLSAGGLLHGAIANALGQTPMHLLRERFPTNHLILTLLYRTLSELYSTASPILAHVPPLVCSLLGELEQIHDPFSTAETIPCLHAYRKEQHTTDTPAYLDLVQLLPPLTAGLSQSPMFSSLQLEYHPISIPAHPEDCQIRFPASAFLYIFVLLSYMLAILSDREYVTVDLYRDGSFLCITLFSETDRLPVLYSARNEFHTLSKLLPEYTGLLTLLQYLLHRNRVTFTSRTCAPHNWYGLECTLYMDTRFREEIEFRHADADAQIADALPDALALLQLLTGGTPLI